MEEDEEVGDDEKRLMLLLLGKECGTVLLLLGCDEGFLELVTAVVVVAVLVALVGGEGEMGVGFVDGKVAA